MRKYNRHAGPDPASHRHAELDSASSRHAGLDPASQSTIILGNTQ